ncbi:hypothetical protein [Methanoregula sp.]|uniref:hypothetical protein n=1 Tax=Methanoregula sp. TaxID=2052170 RepID=UPI0025F76EDE|nr:hypothetical protein [Methanoregula sp.]
MNNPSPCRIPASPMDQFNYALQALGDQSMHMVIAFEGMLDERRLQEAASTVLSEIPVLGSRFVDCGAPYWELLPETDRDTLVCIHPSVDPHQDLPKVLAIPVDSAAGPQICIHLIRTKSSDTLCITVHHAVMDAHGLLACTRLLAECYRNPDYKTLPPTETIDRSLATVLAQFPETVLLCDRPAPEDPPAGWAFPVGPGDCCTRDFAIRTLPASRLDAIKHAGKQQGATVNDVLLAAYFVALCTTIGPSPGCPVPVMVSIDLRRYLNGSRSVSPNNTICNQSVAFAVMMKPDMRSHDGMIACVRDAMQAYKAHNPGIASAIDMETFGYTGFTRICERVQMMKATYAACHANPPFLGNIGIIPEEIVAFSQDIPVTNAFVAGIVIDPPGVALGVTTFKDRLTLSIGYGTPAIPHTAMERFMDTLVSYLPGG